ncbi:P-loop NTPase fold protein [Pseudomonas yamanorum]
MLGRSAFAANLAAAIVGWKNQESLVIALTGLWGSGKSSIKNLSIEELTTTPQFEVMDSAVRWRSHPILA